MGEARIETCARRVTERRALPSALQRFFAPIVLAVSLSAVGAESCYAERIAPLIDPEKLAALRESGANPRVWD
jgi:hypothetical protein